MYAIATEKGLNEEGKMEYEIFGVKLKELRNMKAALESVKATTLLTSCDRPLLKRVLRENERDSIISEQDEKIYLSVYGESFKWSEVELRKMRNIVNFVSIGHRLDTDWYWHVHDIYDEMLDVSKRYFGGTSRVYNEIHISSELLRYLKVFQTIGFKLYQGTPSRCGIARPNIKLGTYSNLSIAKSNAMVLMLLTGETTYCNMNGEIKPIILDGVIRRNLDWQEKKSEKSIARNADFRNPLIPTDIFHSSIEDESGKKYFKKF